MDRREVHGEMLRLPFVFVPNGAEAPAAWRAAHPEVVSLPAKMVLKGQRQIRALVPGRKAGPPTGMLGTPRDRTAELRGWLQELLGSLLEARKNDDGRRPDPRTQRPVDAPPGTLSIDKAGLPDGAVHDLKDELDAGARDWVGIAPNGDVIRPGDDGRAENLGPWRDLTNRGDSGPRRGQRSRGTARSDRDGDNGNR
jgi:hypothetical protein